MQEKRVLQVSELNKLTRLLLEENFPDVLIEGELSNFSAPHSGHWYFSLKDETAQVRCAMFRFKNMTVKFKPKEGQHVLLKANVSLYEGRGDFQLIVNQMEEQGDGLLQKRFEQLKETLRKAGWFDEIHKKPFPKICHRLAVITSATGAALQDVLSTLKRRYPLADVFIYPSPVQGKTAASTLAAAIKQANQSRKADAILLVRGGGSLEDLWPFNEEIVANAIFESALPIVTGVGHEVDFTIADFVADHRAATPTAAAEWISPNQLDLLQQLKQRQQRLTQQIQKTITRHQERLHATKKHLLSLHPKQKLQQRAQQVDFLQQMLLKHMQTQQQRYQQRLANYAGRLNNLSPLQTLSRGYTITFIKDQAITSSAAVQAGDAIRTKLSDGEILSTVERVKTST